MYACTWCRSCWVIYHMTPISAYRYQCLQQNINKSRRRQNCHHFADGIFKWLFMNKNVWVSLKISLKIVPKFRINNIPGLVQIMDQRRPGDKPLSEPLMISSPTHICIPRPHWVNEWAALLLHIPREIILPPHHPLKSKICTCCKAMLHGSFGYYG